MLTVAQIAASIDESPPRRDRVTCSQCGRRVRQWVTRGLIDSPDPDSTSVVLCDSCALQLVASVPVPVSSSA